MRVPVGTVLDALLIESTVGILRPLPFAANTIPSGFVILYPDITQFYYDLYIKDAKGGIYWIILLDIP
jgi:hypothetical protein